MPLRPDMEMAEYLEILRRRKWYIVFSILLILFGASVYCVVTPEKYSSSTTILVIPQRVPEGYVRSTVSTGVDERLFTIQQQVMSRTRLVSVMEELGLFKEERKNRPIEEVVEGMRKRIDIKIASNTQRRRGNSGEDAFTLTFVHESPQMAMLAASRLASYFIDENLKIREQQATGTRSSSPMPVAARSSLSSPTCATAWLVPAAATARLAGSAPADDAASSRVFQAWQAGHWPCHCGVAAPHAPHT